MDSVLPKRDYSILIIDDSVSVVRYLEHIINKRMYGDFKISTAFSGEEATTVAGKNPPDLIFLDINLPRMNGFAVLEYFRKNFSKTPIIVITAELSGVNKIEAFRRGASDYILKPFSSEQILERMAVHLNLLSRQRP